MRKNRCQSKGMLLSLMVRPDSADRALRFMLYAVWPLSSAMMWIPSYDLAGTEGVKDVNMGVERKAEGQQINKGLEEVGRCLNSLIGSGPIVATSTFPNILRQNSGDRCRTA